MERHVGLMCPARGDEACSRLAKSCPRSNLGGGPWGAPSEQRVRRTLGGSTQGAERAGGLGGALWATESGHGVHSMWGVRSTPCVSLCWAVPGSLPLTLTIRWLWFCCTKMGSPAGPRALWMPKHDADATLRPAGEQTTPPLEYTPPSPHPPRKNTSEQSPPGAGEEGPGRQSSWVLTPRGRFLIKEERGPISVGQDSPQILLDLLKKTPDQNFGFLLLNLILWVD